MKKKIMTLLLLNFLGHLQAAERPATAQPTVQSSIEYAGKIYTLSLPQQQHYQQIIRGKNKEIKADKLSVFFTMIEEDFPNAVQKTEALLQQEKLQAEQKENSIRTKLFDEALKMGMRADEALEYVEEHLKGTTEVRAPMAPALIGADGERHPLPANIEKVCPFHPHAACGCVAEDSPEKVQLEECAVCRAELLPEQAPQLSVTPCGHTFHEDCLTQARKFQNICPSCRASLSDNSHEEDEAIARALQQRILQEEQEKIMATTQRRAQQREQEARRERERAEQQRLEREHQARIAQQQRQHRERVQQLAEQEARRERERTERQQLEQRRQTRYQIITSTTLFIAGALIFYKYFTK